MLQLREEVMFVSEAKKKTFSCIVEEHMSSAKLAKKKRKTE
jgi:hypothetical protein